MAAPEAPPAFAAEWERVVERWDEAAAHAIFIERCAVAGTLDLAAARYRPLLEDPRRGARARASLDRVVTLAQAALGCDATPPSRVARNRAIAIAVALAVSAALGIALAVAMLR